MLQILKRNKILKNEEKIKEKKNEISKINKEFSKGNTLRAKILLLKNHIEETIKTQEEKIKHKDPEFSWLNGKSDPNLFTMKAFLEDLLTIDWESYTINEKESFVEIMWEPIGEEKALRIYAKNLKTFTLNGKEEDIFIEIVLDEYEATINYPLGHTHLDYFEYSSGKYIKDNEAIKFIKNILKEELKIAYIFRNNKLIGSGVFDKESNQFLMTYSLSFRFLNPVFWIRKFAGRLKKWEEKEEIVIIDWKK